MSSRSGTPLSGCWSYGSSDEERAEIHSTVLSPIQSLSSRRQSTAKMHPRGSKCNISRRNVTFSSKAAISTPIKRKLWRKESKDATPNSKRLKGLGDTMATNGADDVAVSHTSSSYELAEKGASKVLIDSLQFHLDGLFAARATVSLRRKSSWNLFVICKENATNVSFFRAGGVVRSLTRLPALLLTEQDKFVELVLIALSLILVESDSGQISSSINFPSSSFQALVMCSLDQKDHLKKKCLKSLQSGGGEQEVTTEAPLLTKIYSGLYGRRKIKRKTTTCNSHRRGGDGSTASSVKFDIHSDGSETSPAGEIPFDLVAAIMNTWPQLIMTILPEKGMPSDDELGKALALTAVSSFLMNKAQLCASIRSDSKSCVDGREESTTEKSLRTCQLVLSKTLCICGDDSDKIDEGKDNDAYDLPLIQLYASQLVRALRNDADMKLSAMTWQILGIMDAFCFQNSDTHYLLAGRFSSERPAEVLHMQEELMKLLLKFAPLMKENITKMSSSEFTSPSNGGENLRLVQGSPRRASVLFLSELNCDDKVETADLFSMCLKCLVNLSHGILVCTDKLPYGKDMTALIDLLTFFNDQRMTLAERYQVPGSQRGRIVYDSILHLLVLLTNMVENVYQDERRTKASAQSSKQEQSLSCLVISILFDTSRSFESEIDKENNTVQSGSSDEEPIPVSDLILAAHASLLLFTLGCPSRLMHKVTGNDKNFAETVVQDVTSSNAMADSELIRSALPGQSWWLLVRALKAYLALQSGTGIFLYDNIVPVLEAIHIMQLQDAVASKSFELFNEEKSGLMSEKNTDHKSDMTPAISGIKSTTTQREEQCLDVAKWPIRRRLYHSNQS